MFKSFFPKPKLFFSSVVIWSLLAIAFWYWKGADIGAALGMPQLDPNAPPIIGLSTFWAPDFLWFYIYYAVTAGLFAAFWFFYSPHPMQYWSVIGSAVILFVTYFQVQVSVAINNWYGPFWDMIQAAVGKTRVVTEWDIYRELGVFSLIAIVAVGISVITRFFVAHYIFRWRSAMNDYYMANWSKLRHVEGASQRVQEDTMRFASTTEALGVNLIDSVMTLIAFTPVLIRLSVNVSELPIIGAIPHPLLVAAVLWSLFGTLFIALVGIKLPGLEFRNQRVEAACRKELVYGEDHAERAGPATVRELFSNIRNNYFRLYFHYTYFNFARSFYMQVNNVFSIVILVPSIAAGKISLGALNQISGAFGQVTSSFQYLVSSWSTIIELISIYKRLRAFEAVIEGEPLPDIDQAFIAAGGVEEVAADS